MKLYKLIRVLFLLLVPKLCSASSFQTAEHVSALVAVPVIWTERSHEGDGKVAKLTRIFADIVRLASGALTLKNQYDCDENLCAQKYKYTVLWLLIDAVKLGLDIMPEQFLEQVDQMLANLDEVWLTEFEKSFYDFCSTDKYARRVRTTLLPGLEMAALGILAFAKDQKVKFYAAGLKGLCRSFDEYLGATNITVKRLFLILFVAHLVNLIYDGVLPPVFEGKKQNEPKKMLRVGAPKPKEDELKKQEEEKKKREEEERKKKEKEDELKKQQEENKKREEEERKKKEKEDEQGYGNEYIKYDQNDDEPQDQVQGPGRLARFGQWVGSWFPSRGRKV